MVDFRLNAGRVVQLVAGAGHHSPDCLGRELCRLGATPRPSSVMQTSALKIATAALLWVQLEDRSQSFLQFLESSSKGDIDETVDCDLIFYKCTSI